MVTIIIKFLSQNKDKEQEKERLETERAAAFS